MSAAPEPAGLHSDLAASALSHLPPAQFALSGITPVDFQLKRADCFAACLYLCFDLVPQHVAMELAWLHGMTDAAMPFLIQSAQSLNERVATLERTVNEAKKQAAEARSASAPPPSQTLMIGNTAGGPHF